MTCARCQQPATFGDFCGAHFAEQPASRVIPERVPTCLRTAMEAVQRFERAEQQLRDRKDLPLAELFQLQAAAKHATANALSVAASWALERK